MSLDPFGTPAYEGRGEGWMEFYWSQIEGATALTAGFATLAALLTFL